MIKSAVALIFAAQCCGQYIFRIPLDSLPMHHYESMYRPNVGETLLDRIIHIRERLRALRDMSHAEAGVHHFADNHGALDSSHPVHHVSRVIELIFLIVVALVRLFNSYSIFMF